MSHEHDLHRTLHGLSARLDAMEANNQERFNKIMSAVSDFAAKAQASLDKVNADLDSISTGIAALDTLIQNLQNSPGTLSAADQAALDAIAASSAALATKADAVVPATLPPAPPGP